MYFEKYDDNVLKRKKKVVADLYEGLGVNQSTQMFVPMDFKCKDYYDILT